MLTNYFKSTKSESCLLSHVCALHYMGLQIYIFISLFAIPPIVNEFRISNELVIFLRTPNGTRLSNNNFFLTIFPWTKVETNMKKDDGESRMCYIFSRILNIFVPGSYRPSRPIYRRPDVLLLHSSETLHL